MSNCSQILHKIQKIYKIHAKLLQPERGGAGDARAHASLGKTKRRRPLTQKETKGAASLLHSWSTGVGPHEQSLSPLLTYRLHYSVVDTQPEQAGRLRGFLERSRGERRGRSGGQSYPIGPSLVAENFGKTTL